MIKQNRDCAIWRKKVNIWKVSQVLCHSCLPCACTTLQQITSLWRWNVSPAQRHLLCVHCGTFVLHMSVECNHFIPQNNHVILCNSDLLGVFWLIKCFFLSKCLNVSPPLLNIIQCLFPCVPNSVCLYIYTVCLKMNYSLKHIIYSLKKCFLTKKQISKFLIQKKILHSLFKIFSI